MKIAIVGSVQFSHEMIDAEQQLAVLGHQALLPYSTMKIAKGELSLEEYLKEKEAHGDMRFRNEGPDLIKDHYAKIIEADAILVLNYTKKGIDNYIGGNTLMEIGFAHVNDKKIFMLNDIPAMPYEDEIRAMNPVILHDNLSLITKSQNE